MIPHGASAAIARRKARARNREIGEKLSTQRHADVEAAFGWHWSLDARALRFARSRSAPVCVSTGHR